MTPNPTTEANAMKRLTCSQCGADLGYLESNPCGLCELKALNDPLGTASIEANAIIHQALEHEVVKAAKVWRSVTPFVDSSKDVQRSDDELVYAVDALLTFEKEQGK